MHYRQRSFDAAVKTQRDAVRLDERAALVSQMGRFLAARMGEHGPMTLGDADAGSVEVRLDEPLPNESAPALVIDLADDVERGLEIYALDESGGRLHGTLRIQLGAGMAAGAYRLPSGRGPGRPESDRLQVAYVDASGCGCPPQSLRGRYFRFSREVRRLPGAR